MANTKRLKGDWIKNLSQLHKTRANTPSGQGWLTYVEIRDLQDMGENKVRSLIRQGLEQGTIESYEGSELNVAGRLTRRIWYRFKNMR